MDINDIGWSPSWKNSFNQYESEGYMPGRVSSEYRGVYTVVTENFEGQAEVTGRFRHNTRTRSDFPTVGDWVVVEIPDMVSRCQIHAILPRYSSLVRKAAGTANEEQVLAANIDTVFLVSGLDNDFNERRIERYLTLAYESGVEPVIILNKTDLVEDLQQTTEAVDSIAYGVPVLCVSATNGIGIELLWEYLSPGKTGVLLGSSGVGKSSLINTLRGGNELKTADVRTSDSRGRHTTTNRQLIPLHNGSVLIDTPGMRELQLIANDAALSRSFDDIAELANACRFRDCSHITEPGCAVLESLKTGALNQERYESYLCQRKEIQYQQVAQDIHLQKAEKSRWKAIHASMRNHHKKDNY